MYDDYEKDLKSLYETNKWNFSYVRYDKKPPERLVKAYKDKYKINTDCHHSCLNCQIHHINKYKDQLELEDEKLKEETGKGLDKWFPVSCNYIPKGIHASYKDKLELLKAKGVDEKRAKRLIMASVDSASWLELMFGFDDDSAKDEDLRKHYYLRWYQKFTSRCSANRMVLRWGRRSGKSAVSALKLLHYMFNNKVFYARNSEGIEMYRGPKIAVVCPFETQVTNIFSELEKYLLLNKDLEKEVIATGSKLYTQTPPKTMTFKNGGMIMGFVTGANNKEDGSAGGALRGYSPDIIYLDEMDMIPEYVHKSVIKPFLLTSPFTILIGSSTPIGKKGAFYNMCTSDPIYQEIYVPSTVLPHWDAQEKEILNDATEESFKAEYMADFILDSYGVFKSHYVHAARENYSYDQTDNSDFWKNRFHENFYDFRICIGIDWNQNIGTEYSVVAWSPKFNTFWVLENINIPPSKYSAEEYKNEVKRLNYKWNPHYIYADEGYGNLLIENIQYESDMIMSKKEKTLYEQSVAKISSKLKKINFSSNIEFIHPTQGNKFKKWAKGFLVENLIGIFEREKIRFAEDDKVLVKQLHNYIQVDKKENGKVIYGMENESVGDHRLDALMLGCAGLVIEESIFSLGSIGEAGISHKPLEIEQEDDVDVINKATDLVKLIKRAQNMNYETSNYKPPDKPKVIKEAGEQQGYFSKRHAVDKFVETRRGEDTDENHLYTAVKIEPRKRTIRTSIFGGRP